jgi:hypothetical protein
MTEIINNSHINNLNQSLINISKSIYNIILLDYSSLFIILDLLLYLSYQILSKELLSYFIILLLIGIHILTYNNNKKNKSKIISYKELINIFIWTHSLNLFI